MAQNIETAIRVQQGGAGLFRSGSQPFRNQSQGNRITGPPPRLVLPAPPLVAGPRRAGRKGLCFQCKAAYHPMHDCPMKHLRVLLVADDEGPLLELKEIEMDTEPEEQTEQAGGEQTEQAGGEQLDLAALSLCSAVGFSGPRTMRLKGFVAGREVTILVDSGASHNFISSKLVGQMGLRVVTTGRFGVQLGDGQRTDSAGVCQNLVVQLDSVSIKADCYLFLLGGVYIILGIAWLATLGDVKVNWQKMTMGFVLEGKSIFLTGDHSASRSQATLKSLLHCSSGGIARVLGCFGGANRGQLVEYLGHIVSASGVSMDPTKVQAVVDWPTPKSIKAVRGFLGLTGYYKRFVWDYGILARPLTQLLKKDAPARFVWSVSAEEALRALSADLGIGPVPSSSNQTSADLDIDENVATVKFLATQFEKHLEENDYIETRSELTRYLGENCEKNVESFNVLKWWKDNSMKYRVLSQIARDVLAIPVSTVASESAFSTSGRILDPYRSSLNHEMVEALVCCQNWLRSEPFTIDIQEFMKEVPKEEVEKYEEVIKGCRSQDMRTEYNLP
ncbi:hypothetical protein BUALT_Bualt03G0194600 [Buddleja alternifolia]|uniref:HAT C-terminal dimerisation domain-containing protein n=1 Tax=Buddleja alternifolia TaxID=168488 RepID=A0AAV6Y1P5_9LAMI|nr:hypothetical protein BUALT_Bualt03G0194600 [Buddleja alternifolia]